MPLQYTMSDSLERQCRQALRNVADAEEICKLAEACKHDTTAQRALCEYYREQLSLYIQHLSKRPRE